MTITASDQIIDRALTLLGSGQDPEAVAKKLSTTPLSLAKRLENADHNTEAKVFHCAHRHAKARLEDAPDKPAGMTRAEWRKARNDALIENALFLIEHHTEQHEIARRVGAPSVAALEIRLRRAGYREASAYFTALLQRERAQTRSDRSAGNGEPTCPYDSKRGS